MQGEQTKKVTERSYAEVYLELEELKVAADLAAVTTVHGHRPDYLGISRGTDGVAYARLWSRKAQRTDGKLHRLTGETS